MTASQTRLDWVTRATVAKGPAYVEISDKVWEYAELRFRETQAVATQIAALEGEDFAVTQNVAGMPTAFVAWRPGPTS